MMLSVIPIIIRGDGLSIDDFPVIKEIVIFISNTPWAKALLMLLIILFLLSVLWSMVKLIRR